jgi:hypothetical protein
MRTQRYTPLATGDFDENGVFDVALVGRGGKNDKSVLFLLVASRHQKTYRRLYFQELDWSLAALKDSGAYLILADNYHPSDDFWFLCWTGKRFDLRYIGDFMDSEPCPRRGRSKTR